MFTPPIDRFFGQYRFLSNFWMVPILYEGIVYPSVEHAYVAAKTTDERLRQEIAQISTPGRVKRAGRALVLRPDWDKIKFSIMLELVTIKFQDPALAAMLKATGDAHLIEGNTWNDTYWGVCNGRGENMLGKILMYVRSTL